MGLSGVIQSRKYSCALILGMVVWRCALAAPEPARAQEDAAKAEAAPAATAPAEAVRPQPGQVEPKPVEKSRIWWFIESSGAIGAVILLLSIYFVSTVSRLFLEMRQKVAAPPDLIEELMELLQKREFKEIFSIVKDDTSFFGRLLASGIAELPNGLAEARDSMERVGEAVTVEMEKKISMLAVLGTLGPMIGLLGTLKGMIASFSVIALSDVQLKASQVADGISQALVLTFEGVALSVPAIYFFAIFRNRVAAISVATLLQADEFLRHFAHAARVKTPPAGQPTAMPAATKPAKP
ncbi:MAG: MotA/TolQ/ExbB proton channel family protein [Planctomycetia bacterium]|nr:MotA/TolQ/ExbB proton channel family protein [Planctomycetia bacterium]